MILDYVDSNRVAPVEDHAAYQCVREFHGEINTNQCNRTHEEANMNKHTAIKLKNVEYGFITYEQNHKPMSAVSPNISKTAKVTFIFWGLQQFNKQANNI